MSTTATATPAQAFAAELAESGSDWHIRVTDHGGSGGIVVELTTRFAAGDADAYMAAERTAQAALRALPMRYAGSVWGSDSGSVGGHAALTSGDFRYLKSGIGKRDAAAVAKAAGVTIGAGR